MNHSDNGAFERWLAEGVEQAQQAARERLARAEADHSLAVRFAMQGIVPATVYNGRVTLEEADAENLLTRLEAQQHLGFTALPTRDQEER